MASQSPIEGMSLEQKAIAEARSHFDQLKNGDQLFQRCIGQTNSISHLMKCVDELNRRHKRKRSFKLSEQLKKNAERLQSFSSVVELAVHAKADVLCPLWAPVAFIIQVRECCLRNFHLFVLRSNPSLDRYLNLIRLSYETSRRWWRF